MSTRRLPRCVAALALAFATCAAAKGKDRAADAFDDAQAWTALASDQVDASLRVVDEEDGHHALCLAFDFHGVSGYAAMRRTLAIDYPDNYEWRYRLRGDAPDNDLQFKLIDASGDNVWWMNRKDVIFPAAWQAQRVRQREIAFAWGPTADKRLRHSAAIEFTLYAGKGGRGEVCFDRLALHALPLPPAEPPRPRAQASSALADAPASNAADGDTSTAWRSDPRRGAEQAITLDLGYAREFGGLLLRWRGDEYASRYDIDLSADARNWRRARRVQVGNGGVDALALTDAQARYLRIALHDGPHKRYALAEVQVEPLAFGSNANTLFAELAKAAPRGRYPRGFYNEQTYWTVVGIDGGHESGLLSEDGALEVARGGFSIEPFLREDGALASWADVAIDHSLPDGYLPMPRVTWSHDGLRLTTSAFGSGTRAASQLVANYTLENTSPRERTITLALALRPFQVNPSVQFLNTPGGVSPIHDLAFAKNVVTVDGKPRVITLSRPDAFFASAFDAGMAVDQLASATRLQDGATSLHDETGLASGALLYRLRLPAHAQRRIVLAIPLDGAARPPTLAAADVTRWLSMQEAAVAAQWRHTLDDVVLKLPAPAQPLADTLRTALADILISRDGVEIRPGTRAYARSWIRDGAMISDALLRLGQVDAVRDYLQWYAPYQFRSGKVPCCVDARGADPVPENDSHGELIHLVAALYRYGGDRALLEKMWPHVDAATHYMDRLRANERSAAKAPGANRAFRGLMPASISHEGYSAKPMHSYWDDFWALTGYDDALDMAGVLGREQDAGRLRESRDEFRDDVYASIKAAVAAHHIDYLPGSAELGDFDPTSTTIALSPAGQQARLPQDLLHATFERYWTNFITRRDGNSWKDYTPYEWRVVGAFVRLGWRERAQEASDFFMRDRRPAGWNQWAEVVGRDPREARFIGDMPHGWVASDFIRATLDRFAYERAADHALVLAAGLPSAWFDGEGVAITNLRTPYGRLSYSIKRVDGTLHVHVDGGDLRAPTGGIVLALPVARSGADAAPAGADELRINALPADLAIDESTRQTR